jgi:hypothetical protein
MCAAEFVVERKESKGGAGVKFVVDGIFIQFLSYTSYVIFKP